MKKLLMGLMVMMMVASCSTVAPVNPSKPEMSVDERYPQPKTYNQYHNNWNY